ncbi:MULTISPECIES: hypothetical protein [unclassified Streptomyces]|uniref:hypothetical protein n=1 Tax=unclassified Streptomyces TaxID=2593676 RepID=UPI0013D90963|nr:MULTISPECIES: hypothetical protein [unclassified Streptomyces]
MSVRRPLLTAVAAGILLCAMWFVPSANATSEQSTGRQQSAAADQEDSAGLALADTGAGVDTTPYLIAGTAFLCVGAAFVAHSRRGASAL